MTEVEKEIGIRNLQEVLEAMGELTYFAGSIFKDNKIGLDDLQHLISLGSKFEKFKLAIEGAGEIPLEVANLKQEEVLMIITSVYAAVDRFSQGKKA